MSKSNIKNTLATVVLIVTLGIIVGSTAKSVYSYYTGPHHIVDTYIKYLSERNYDKLYLLLHQESIRNIGDKNEIIAYYKRKYEQKNQLFLIL